MVGTQRAASERDKQNAASDYSDYSDNSDHSDKNNTLYN
jgi:hypothetical protein